MRIPFSLRKKKSVLGLDSIWGLADEHRLSQLLAPGLLCCRPLRRRVWWRCQLGTGGSVEVGEPLALAGRKSCDFCRRSLTRQESGGWRGAGPGLWGDGTRHRACYFLALWTGSLRAVVITSAGGGRQHEQDMTVPSGEGQVPVTDTAGGLLSGVLLWGASSRP